MYSARLWLWLGGSSYDESSLVCILTGCLAASQRQDPTSVRAPRGGPKSSHRPHWSQGHFLNHSGSWYETGGWASREEDQRQGENKQGCKFTSPVPQSPSQLGECFTNTNITSDTRGAQTATVKVPEPVGGIRHLLHPFGARATIKAAVRASLGITFLECVKTAEGLPTR